MPNANRILTLLTLVPLAVGTATPPVRAQDEAAAIKNFKRDFKPKAKSIELSKVVAGLRTDSQQYLSELERRSKLTDLWVAAVRGLRGFGSPAIARLVTSSWLQLDKEVVPLWTKHDKLEKRIERDYARLLEMNDGKGMLPGKRYPATVVAAQQQWLRVNREASEIRRDITELTTLHDELRQVAVAMQDPAGLTWMLQNTIGSKKHALALKVAAIRAAAQLGEPMLPVLTSALAKAGKPDVIAALLLGIGMLGERAKGAAEQILPLLGHSDGGVAEQAALALQHMKVGAAIEPMIILLAREGGQARLRIASALEILTGQQHGTNIAAWQGWFAKEGAAYAAGDKPLGLGKPSQHRKYDQENYYYGIPQHGKGIIYVIDCSGSMVVDKDTPKWGDPQNSRLPEPATDPANSRSEASKRELVRAIRGLSGDKTFNIIWYNHAATLFRKSMVPATPKNVEAAFAFIRGLPADSSTNIYEAMKLAFTITGRGSYDKHYGVEFDTIFLLTDGKPTLQGVGDDDPMKIIEGVRQWNPLQRVVIHTIAMGESGIDHDFMQKLASENRGEYRKILKGGKIEKGDGEPADKEPEGKEPAGK